MSLSRQSSIHKRRGGMNIAIALCLVALISLLTSLSLVKMVNHGPKEGYDHAIRSSVIGEEE